MTLKDTYLKALTPAAIKKKINTYKRINHQQGSKNSQFGTMWITDSVVNKKIMKTEVMPENFRKGRI